MPQDVKLSPDGRVFYVADMHAGGLWEIDGDRLQETGFLPTGRRRARPLPEPRRRLLYVTNRRRGIDLGDQLRAPARSSRSGGSRAAAARTWAASPPTARCSGSRAATTRVVYAISTRNGRLLAKIPVGAGPHGLCVWPQPGRYSLGHTGILR